MNRQWIRAMHLLRHRWRTSKDVVQMGAKLFRQILAVGHCSLFSLAVLFSVVFGRHTFGQENAGRISITNYKKLLLEQRDSIKSMQFTVSSKLSFDKAVERAGLLRGAVLSSTVRMSWSGDKSRSERSTKSINSNGLSASENMISVFNGSKNIARELDSQKFILQEELSNFSVIDNYRNALLWPVSPSEFDWCQRSPSEVYFLPYFLNENDWEVLPELKSRDTVSCVVFRRKDGARELWLDPARDHCLIYYWQERPMSDTLRWSMAYSAHKEVLPGLYLPTRIKVTHELADPSDVNKPLGEFVSEVAITNLSVNDVEDSVFILEPEPGDWVIDNLSGTSYRYYPEDDTTLEDSVGESVLDYGERFRGSSARSILFTLNIVLVLILAAYFIARHIRSKR